MSGYVFHDIDGDGVRDPGEPGLRRTVRLNQGGALVAETRSGTDGNYRMGGLPAGEYEVVTKLDDAIGFCGDPPAPDFNPLRLRGCIPFMVFQWHPTTPEGAGIALAAGADTRIDFGGQPYDQGIIMGRAILGDGYAPAGSPVEALYGGGSCGTAAIGPNGDFGPGTFFITVSGGGEAAGCPEPGQAVRFRVGGVDATETGTYSPQTGEESSGLTAQLLTAMPDHAWYWAQQGSADPLPAGAAVEAVVDGKVCGATVVASALWASGFTRLVVPSDSLQPGCGRPGAPVGFRIDGADTSTTIPWSAGVQRVTLTLSGQSSPTPTPAPLPTPSQAPSPATLPIAGGPQYSSGSAIPELMGAALGVLGFAAVLALGATRPRNGPNQ